MIHDTPMEIMKVFLNCFAFEEVDSVQLDIDIDMQAAGFLKKLSHIHGALIWINVSREVGTMTATCVVGMEIKMPP